MNPNARTVVRPSLNSDAIPPSQSARMTFTIASRLAAKAREAVAADVMPEHITVKQTRNVTKCTPNALCTYSAAPPAFGYLVTSSR